MSGVTVSGGDPNAVDRSTADQGVLSEIQSGQRTALVAQANQVVDAVTHMFGGAQPPPGALSAEAGPGYQFSPEEIQHAINQLHVKLDRLDGYRHQLDTIRFADFAPALDKPGSVMHATALKKGFANVQAAILNERDKVKAWLNLLTRTKQAYLEQDQLTEQQWQRLTLGLAP
jgi:hypothetical protein